MFTVGQIFETKNYGKLEIVAVTEKRVSYKRENGFINSLGHKRVAKMVGA